MKRDEEQESAPPFVPRLPQICHESLQILLDIITSRGERVISYQSSMQTSTRNKKRIDIS